MAQPGVPEDLVVVGYVTGAYGVAGWVRVKPFSADADALLGTRRWWLSAPGPALVEAASDVRDVDMLQAKSHGGDVVAQLMGVVGRDAAEALKGAQVQISRNHFPALSDDEFYWIDLIGLSVQNLRGEPLGVVSDLMDNGAHPILRVATAVSLAAAAGTADFAGPAVAVAGGDADGQDMAAAPAASTAAAAELLIPFVDRFVKTVDQAAKVITVDWELDY